ncbi:Telo-bind domain-containing protein [Mycena indigotica]|uniref:Telo-bind domain-containing protein n=1 Tax=Mycena indigotica TaxID=2126181 RepID=A0A8H6SB63_9AGAR|nr:Telo-bind domain-containing protein [Mycena indigotica]KAF7295511.1 Telo-bind domain-containing protein [Mycena indigotica]
MLSKSQKRPGEEFPNAAKRVKRDNITLKDKNATNRTNSASTPSNSTDDWFMTPRHNAPAKLFVKKPTVMDVEEVGENEEMASLDSEPPPGLSKAAWKNKQRKLRAKQRKFQAADPAGNSTRQKTSTVDVDMVVDPPVKLHQSEAPKPKVKADVISANVETLAKSPSPPPPITSTTPPVPQPPSRYTTLASTPQNGSIFSVIGVVAFVAPLKKTSSGDWSHHMRIVDSSNCNATVPSNKEGYTINSFASKHSEWLPNVQVGSVVILHGLKSKPDTNWGAVGYKDLFQWAIYDAIGGRVWHGDLGQAPSSELITDKSGRRRNFSPFYAASGEDMNYCIGLHDWWTTVQDIRGKDVINVQITPPSRRPHCNPSQANSQYFDWTAEVLHKQQNEKTYTLYLTDYTEIPEARSCHQDWCPSALSGCVLRLEMFDKARQIGPTMTVGQIYCLKNIRKDFFYDNKLQGKIVENKISKLNENDHRVAEILARKAQVDISLANVSECESEVTCVENIRPGFNGQLLVELVRSENSEIYVTDYTTHPQLPLLRYSWAKGLDHRILQISLFDKQAEHARLLQTGQYFVFEYVRINQKYSSLSGRMGGDKMLMHKTSLQSPKFGHLVEELIQRKKNIGGPQHVSPHNPIMKSIATPTASPPKKSISPKPFAATSTSIPTIRPAITSSGKAALARTPQSDATHTINELQFAEFNGPFIIHARVIDFHPLKLAHAFKRVCRRCLADVEEEECHLCHDSKYVKVICRLCVLVEDESGAQLQLSISGRDTPILSGFEAVLLHENREAADRFSQRMRPLLGNLEEVHTELENGRRLEPSGMAMNLMVDRWQNREKEWVYGLHSLCDI